MKSITIQNFKGVNLFEGLWSEGYSSWAKGVDFMGLNDNPQKISFPGIMQGAIKDSIMAEASGVSGITEPIQDFAYYPEDLKFYAIGRVNPGRIYRLENSGGTDTWTWVSAITVSGNGNNLQEYSGELYYATNSYIGKYNGTTGDANWNSFSDSLTSPRPMKVFGGSLYVGAGRYVSKYDGVTWTEQKLILPDDFVVRSLEVYEDRLFITADDLAQSKVFVWDGVSVTYEDFITVGDESRGISIVASNGLLWGVSNKGSAFLTNQVYVFNGNIFEAILTLPIQRTDDFAPPLGIASYKNGVLIASSDPSAADYEAGSGGLWYVGKDLSRGEYYSVLLFTRNSSATTRVLYGCFTGGNLSPNSKDIPVLWSNLVNTTYEILTLDTTNYYTDVGGTWQSLPIDAGTPNTDKIWNSIEIDAESDISSTNSVAISYRLNHGSTWTTLKTLTATTDINKRIPIRAKGRAIEIRIVLGSSSSRGTRVRAFTLNYEETK